MPRMSCVFAGFPIISICTRANIGVPRLNAHQPVQSIR
jgi:hypothetical protein